VETLVVLDEATQRKLPGAAAGTQPPTPRTLRAAMARLNTAMRAARAAGRSVDFHFVFAGHGEAIATSAADFNHVTIDACNAQTLLLSRGAGEPDDGWRLDDERAAVSKRLSAQDLRAYPNTGAMLSSPAGREERPEEVDPPEVEQPEWRPRLRA